MMLFIFIYEEQRNALYIDWCKYKILNKRQFKTSMCFICFEKNDKYYERTIKYEKNDT